jgi:MFS transporter, ACDE family, multidrug resistance protein
MADPDPLTLTPAADEAPRRDSNLPIVFGVALMAVLRADSLTPAFPRIARAFQVSDQQTALLITVFALPSVVIAPLLGILADRWGRKTILVPSLLLFGLGGGACALARDFNLLAGAYLLQGIGAASLSLLNITLLADLYPGKRGPTIMGYNSSLRAFGSMLFPALGGVLAGIGWFYPFYMPLLAIPLALLVWKRLKNPEPSVHTNFATYMKDAWRSLHSRAVTRLFVAGGVTFIVMFGAYLGYFPFLLNSKFNASPLAIGLLVSCRPFVTALMAAQLGKLARRWGETRLYQFSFLLYAAALLLIPLVPDLVWMVAVMVLLGTAEGLYWPSNFTLLGKLAPPENRAGFLAFNDMVMKLGQTVGPILMGAVASAWGAQAAFFTAAALTGLTFIWLIK